MPSRRKLITYTLSTLVIAPIASSLVVYQWWNTAPDAPYTHLNTLEAQTVRLVSRAAFPKGSKHKIDGGDINLDRFFDGFIGHLNEQNASLLKLLLEGLERMPIISHASYYSSLSPQAQQSFLEDCLKSDSHLVRSAFQSLIAILGMGYTTHPSVAKQLSQYHTCGYG